MLQKWDKHPLTPPFFCQIFHYLLMRHHGLSGTSCIWEMLCCHSDEERHPRLVGQGQKKVKDYEAVPMQIGFLYYPEFHHFPRRAYTFLILQGCFSPLCVIYHFVNRERLSDPCSLCRPAPICCDTICPGERLCTSPGYLHFHSKVGLTGGCTCSIWTHSVGAEQLLYE